MEKIKYILLLVFVLLAVTMNAQPDRKEVRSGNRAYSKGKYDVANTEYRRALEKDSLSFFAGYNLGNALYKSGNSSEAQNVVSRFTEFPAQPQAKAAMFHNLGNYALDQKNYSEAVEFYKNSLRINPADMETKSNLAYAQKMMENDNQNQNQDQNQDQKQDQNQDQNQDQDQEQPQQKITPQTAQQMLQAIQNKERETQEKVNKEKAKILQSRQKEKNW